MARLRSAPSTQQPGPTATHPKTREALKEKTNTTRAKAPVYENDGNTEDLVKDARSRRGGPKKVAPAEEEFVMAGGLGLAASRGKTLDRNAAPPTTDGLAKSDGVPPPAAKANRRLPRTTRKIVQSEEQREVMEAVKRRMQATSRKENIAPELENEESFSSSENLARKSTTRRSGRSAVDRSKSSSTPSPPPPSKLNTAAKQRTSLIQPGSALRSHGTPAVESSILALKNFKRRPRQPSMLQMVQQRTASARPSGVHHASSELDAFDLSNAEDDVEEFEPEAEGTPFHVAKQVRTVRSSSKPVTGTISNPISATKKRKPGDAELSSPSALEALRSKRRKSAVGELHEDPLVSFREAASVPTMSQQGLRGSSVRVTAELQVADSQPVSTPPTEPSSGRRSNFRDEDLAIPSTEQAEDIDQAEAADAGETEFDVTGTMADPLSSSPPPPLSPVVTQRTDIMAGPLTQITPPRPQRDKRAKQSKKPAPMTTATLQSLLPKRRQPFKPRKRKSEYEFDLASDGDENPLDSYDLEENEDELGGKLRRQTKSNVKNKDKRKTTTSGKTTARQSKNTQNRKSPVAPPRQSTSTSKNAKTYSRGITSDKENNNADDDFSELSENDDSALPDTSISMCEAAQSKELEAAKKKFAKIDEWDMEFESMSFEEHRSSSQGWR